MEEAYAGKWSHGYLEVSPFVYPILLLHVILSFVVACVHVLRCWECLCCM